jgi:hypothetical protein
MEIGGKIIKLCKIVYFYLLLFMIKKMIKLIQRQNYLYQKMEQKIFSKLAENKIKTNNFQII